MGSSQWGACDLDRQPARIWGTQHRPEIRAGVFAHYQRVELLPRHAVLLPCCMHLDLGLSQDIGSFTAGTVLPVSRGLLALRYQVRR